MKRALFGMLAFADSGFARRGFLGQTLRKASSQ